VCGHACSDLCLSFEIVECSTLTSGGVACARACLRLRLTFKTVERITLTSGDVACVYTYPCSRFTPTIVKGGVWVCSSWPSCLQSGTATRSVEGARSVTLFCTSLVACRGLSGNPRTDASSAPCSKTCLHSERELNQTSRIDGINVRLFHDITAAALWQRASMRDQTGSHDRGTK
jgi:hypothetical protein